MKIKNLSFVVVLIVSLFLWSSCAPKKGQVEKANTGAAVWSVEKAQAWGKSQPWLRGTNYIPANSINSLEMWQAETFDTITINRELGWAAGLGFNCMRVFLHHLAWEIDKPGFKKRMNDYLAISEKHGIKTMFVLFDDCWMPSYMPGKQPNPKPGIHNSGWAQDPGDVLFVHAETSPVRIAMMNVLEEYVKDILTTFKDDKRIVVWDLYNEPSRSFTLLETEFNWARAVNPSQPLTSGVFSRRIKEIINFQLKNSDIVSYHNYSDEVSQQKAFDTLKIYNRPMICTEYMARRSNSLFSNVMPFLKEHNIGAINWGFVSGKTNTIYAWGTPIYDGSEPPLWFHDVLRKDGSPYKQEEVDVIKKLTSTN